MIPIIPITAARTAAPAERVFAAPKAAKTSQTVILTAAPAVILDVPPRITVPKISTAVARIARKPPRIVLITYVVCIIPTLFLPGLLLIQRIIFRPVVNRAATTKPVSRIVPPLVVIIFAIPEKIRTPAPRTAAVRAREGHVATTSAILNAKKMIPPHLIIVPGIVRCLVV